MNARDEILNRIRSANEADVSGTQALFDTASYTLNNVTVDYLKLFQARLKAYGVKVHETSVANLADLIYQRARAADVSSLIMASGLTENWITRLDIQTDLDIDDISLAKVHGAITYAAVGIAETGTVVLDHDPEQGRRVLSLLPDWHFCILSKQNVVPNVSDAISKLKKAAIERRPMTFISGPSATVDIEFRRVKGVHGPRQLEVALLN